MTEALQAACAEAVHTISPDGRVMRAGRAALWIMAELGWPRLARLLGTWPFIVLVELGYRLIANNRPLLGRLLFGS